MNHQSAMEDFYIDLESAAFEQIWSEITARKTERIKWDVISKSKLTQTWNSFAKFGFVRNESAVDEIAATVISNVAKILVITIILGHTQQDPVQYINDKMEDFGVRVSSEDIDEFSDFLTDEKGAFLLSDYALDKMVKLAVDIIAAEKSEDKLILIDQLLNLVHQRSDLASWFVEGGSKTLSQLSERG